MTGKNPREIEFSLVFKVVARVRLMPQVLAWVLGLIVFFELTALCRVLWAFGGLMRKEIRS